MHRGLRSAATALLAGLLATAVGTGPAGASPVAGQEDLSGAELRLQERRLLGPAHAEEHLQQRAAARLEAKLAATGGPTFTAAVEAQAFDPAIDGVWRAPFEMPAVATHSAVLPTGKVMVFSRTINNDVDLNEASAYLWDPSKAPGQAGEFKAVPPGKNIWCGGQSLMADGQLLVTGGNLDYPGPNNRSHKGLNMIFTFDPWSETWTRQPDMAHGRWYPTQTLLPDGRTLITSGLDENGSFGWNTDIDVFTPPATRGGQGSVSRIARYGELTGSPNPPYWYPHWFVMPSGGVLNAGVKSNESWLLNPAPGAVSGSDRPDWSMNRKYGSAVLVPDSPAGSTRVMQLGGYNHVSTEKLSVASTEIFDEAKPTVAPSAGPVMRVPRSHHNTVLLPDRSMINVGGGYGERSGNLWAAGDEHKQIEILDPGSSTWRLGPAQARKRAYHSTAVLLPDGRVLSGGDDGDASRGADYQKKDQAEIYEPAYLHKPGARPDITSAPASVGYTERFGINTSTPIASAVLIAPGATTHANDMSQRLVPLSSTPRADGTGADITAPPNANVAPPGHYMLFAVNADGKPSTAKWVRVGGGVTPPPDTTAPAAPGALTATAGNGSVALAWAASTSSDVARYDVYRTAPGTPIKVSPASQGTTRTFTDTGLVNGTTYSYVVRAIDGAGNQSADSGSASATPTAGTGASRTLALTAVADTMVKQASPSSTFGAVTSLKVDGQELSTTGSSVSSYLRFDVPVLASGETITGSSLRLAVTNATVNGPGVFRSDAGWGETTLSWNSTDPVRNPTGAVGNFGSMGTGAVSTAISGVTGAGLVSLELVPETGDGLDFAARETGTAANRPQLILTIAQAGG